jgi:hypothetical protein
MKNRMLLFIIVVLLAIVILQTKLIISIKQIDYTVDDMHRVKDIILEKTKVTDLDYAIYDLNNDGIIDGFDMMIIKRHFLDIEKISNIKIIKSR